MKKTIRNLSSHPSSIHAGIDKIASQTKKAIHSTEPRIDRMANGAHQAINRTSSAFEKSSGLVKKHPWKALGVVLGLGLIMGRVF